MWDDYPVIKSELAAFEAYLEGRLPKRNEFLNSACRDVVMAGGKRLRPAFTIIAAMSGNYRRENAFPAAAAIEVLHTATLVHDDIIDNAKTRRGRPTISEKHDINLAVYTGDYLLAKSLRFLVETGLKPERLDIVTHAVNLLCEGEIDQYLGKYAVASVNNYLKRVIRKTGVLFSASALLGARCADIGDGDSRLFARFGLDFGAAFQIRDDLNDMESDEKSEGKPVKNDLKEGIATLPVILAIRNDPELKGTVEEYFSGNGDVRSIIKRVASSDGTRDAIRLKQKYKDKCKGFLSQLPPSIATEALNGLVERL